MRWFSDYVMFLKRVENHQAAKKRMANNSSAAGKKNGIWDPVSNLVHSFRLPITSNCQFG
jgi:hypothetical protein